MNNLAFLHPQHETTALKQSEQQYSQLKTHFDSKNKINWCMMKATPRPCFSVEILDELHAHLADVRSQAQANSDAIDFFVLASDVEGVFSLGGDLNLFTQLIKQKDAAGLLAYATSCVDMLCINMNHLDSDLTTISLVQGDALGGGFEGALASNVLIAERGSKMGLPEVLFNLFPGMGAYSLLSRKVGTGMAEKIIFSGKLYDAEELYEMGIVDILAEKGEGELALYQYVKSANRAKNSHQAMRKVKDICNPITREELMDITKVWVEAALNLGSKDLRMMERLVKRQNTKAID